MYFNSGSAPLLARSNKMKLLYTHVLQPFIPCLVKQDFNVMFPLVQGLGFADDS